MTRDITRATISVADIELEARRLRAEATKEMVRRAGAWFARTFRGHRRATQAAA